MSAQHRQPRLLLPALAVLAVAVLALSAGTGPLLGVLPVLLLVVPLLRGRYVGEELIARARRAMTRRRRWPVALPVVRHARAATVRPSRIAAFACGVRGPPAAA